MPFLQTLEGPNLGYAPFPAQQPFVPPQLRGVTDTLSEHPWVALGGLFIGAWLAYKKIRPFRDLFEKLAPGHAWGTHHAAHAREKALTGPKRRRRR